MSDLLKGITTENQAILAKAKADAQRLQAAGEKAKSPEDIEKAAADFEALMLEQMMKSMWQTVPQDGLLSGSREEGLYREMLNKEWAKDISEGQGIGIKKILIREFEKHQKD